MIGLSCYGLEVLLPNQILKNLISIFMMIINQHNFLLVSVVMSVLKEFNEKLEVMFFKKISEI